MVIYRFLNRFSVSVLLLHLSRDFNANKTREKKRKTFAIFLLRFTRSKKKKKNKLVMECQHYKVLFYMKVLTYSFYIIRS